MKEKSIVSTITLAASLISYFYAKETAKDAVPYVMIGGFIGALAGELLVRTIAAGNSNNKEKEK
jgi:hypothetical protein